MHFPTRLGHDAEIAMKLTPRARRVGYVRLDEAVD
jgi:hypothetical protein